MRPIFHFLEKMREAKARKASQALNIHKRRPYEIARQQKVNQLAAELGRPPLKLMRRG